MGSSEAAPGMMSEATSTTTTPTKSREGAQSFPVPRTRPDKMLYPEPPLQEEPQKKETVSNPSRRSFLIKFGSAAAALLIGGGVIRKILDDAESSKNGTNNVDVPSTFDPNALKSTLGADNMAIISAKDAPPLWDDQTKTLSLLLAIDFHGSIPTLEIEKTQDSLNPNLYNIITIKRLRAGYTLKSPFNGKITIYRGTKYELQGFDLATPGPQGRDVTYMYITGGLKSPLLDDKDKPKVYEASMVKMDIKEGEVIGNLLFDGPIQITGFGPLLKRYNFNIPTTSAEKATVIQ